METIIVGGGQAGLALSYFLTRQARAHVVLEQAAQLASAWRGGRWDSFTLVTPAPLSRLPGTEDWPMSETYLPRDQIVAYFEEYARRFQLPVRCGVRVTTVEPSGAGWRVQSDAETLEAPNVVIATGLYQRPKIPAISAKLPAEIVQLHSGQYRSPPGLPPGAVLVVGTGQSGCQIAEELYQSGRKVYLSVGGAIRLPAYYRGRHVFDWLTQNGFLDRTPDKLPTPKAKFTPTPHLSGTRGGHTLNLHQFARDGVVLLGHLQGIAGTNLLLAPDLKANLARADQGEADILKGIDAYIERNALDAPLETPPQLRDGFNTPERPQLDFEAAGITSVIWATGYGFDFSLVGLPVFDGDGYPVQRRGVTAYPGLYFLGLPWLHKMKSGLLLGVGDDAAYLADHIAQRSAISG